MIAAPDSLGRIGTPSLALGKDTIATILDLVRCGWQDAICSGDLDVSSDEPWIAGCLGRAMIAEKRRRRIKNIRFEEEVGTRRSLNAQKVAGRIDIKVIFSFDEEEYFGIECKRVSDSRGDRLASKYVSDGVMRFVSGKYSPGHSWAAMLGFVIDGDIESSVVLIQAAILAKKREVMLRNAWTAEGRFGSYEHLYRTGHGQARRGSTIHVLHFFLNFCKGGPDTER